MLGPNGLLKGKARVLCTNSVAFLSQTDNLIMLRGGEIVEQSTYDQVMEARDSPLFSLINGLGKQTDSSPGTPGESSDGTAVGDLDLEKLGETDEKKRRLSLSSLRNAPVLYVQHLLLVPTCPPEAITDLMDLSRLGPSRSLKQSKANAIRDLRESSRPKEVTQQGQVKTTVYRSYISAASTLGVIFFLLATFAGQGASIAGNLVLRAWGERNLDSHKTASIGFFLFLYGVSGLASSFLNMTASLLLWAFCAVVRPCDLSSSCFS